MKFCIWLTNNDEVIVEAEAVDNLAEFAAIGMKERYVSGRLHDERPLLVPWHAVVAVLEAKE
jgi:hypothetical protein